MNRTITVILLSVSGLAACSGNDSHAHEVDACVARGVAYFKEVGSYPTLKSAPNAGRSAEDVAIERCNRSIQTF